MSLEGIYEILLRGLAETLPPTALHYISREQAYVELKRRTGQDFGNDVERWRDYLRANVPLPENAGIATTKGD
jgi:hypothetical protein